MKRESKHSKNAGRRYAHSAAPSRHKATRINTRNASSHRVKRINKSHLQKENSSNSFKRINIKKIIVTIVIILVVIFGIVEITSYFHRKTETDNQNIKEISLDSTQKVEGLDNIEVSGINIKMKENTTTIEIKFKNNSDQNQLPFNGHISILDKDTYKLFGTQCSIPEIQSKSESIYNIICNDDLSNSTSYEFNKIN